MRIRRRVSVFLVAALAAGVLAGCGAETLTVSATFEDVGDLAPGAPVTMADIQIGKVDRIKLAGQEAVVTMSLDTDARVPEGVQARVRRTSVLGERIVDIVLPEDLTDDTELLADGAHIDDTAVRTDLEDLVDEGAEVFGAISATQLAVMIEEGARGFGGQGAALGGLLQNYRDIVHRYANRSDEIVTLIGSLKNFNETVAARSDEHARSIVNTSRSIEVLAEESLNLEKAVISLGRLARGSKSILQAHSAEMGRFFQQMSVILGVIEEEQVSLAKILKWAPGHNYNTQAVEYTEFNQVVQDFVICGLNDDPKNPARRCEENE
jgi:phospholipid/cholesterol/gamma-HCH transport system substrate-binding protein